MSVVPDGWIFASTDSTCAICDRRERAGHRQGIAVLPFVPLSVHEPRARDEPRGVDQMPRSERMHVRPHAGEAPAEVSGGPRVVEVDVGEDELVDRGDP